MKCAKRAQTLSLSAVLHLLVSLSLGMASGQEVYHNQFAVELAGGDELAEVVALRHGLLYMGKVGDLSGHYLFQSQHLEKRFDTEVKYCFSSDDIFRSAEPCQETRAKLESDPDVVWFEQQKELSRRKRGGEL